MYADMTALVLVDLKESAVIDRAYSSLEKSPRAANCQLLRGFFCPVFLS